MKQSRPVIISSFSLVIACFATALFGQSATQSQLPTYRVTNFPVGSNPVGLTFDGISIWVTNVADNSISKLRASDGVLLGTFGVGTNPLYAAFDGTNVWVSNAPDTVTKLRASDGALLGTFDVGDGPQGITFDGRNIWVANVYSNNVTKLRATDGTVLGTFPTGEGPFAILVNGTHIWTAGAGSIAELRGRDGAEIADYAISGAEPYLRSIVSDGHNLWVGEYGYPGSPGPGRVITEINPRNGAVLRSVNVGKGPSGLAFDGRNIWVSNANSNTVSIVDPQTAVDLQDVAVGKHPGGILFDGVNIWVANQASNSVSKVSPQ